MKVSIITPLYKPSDDFYRTYNSVLKQTADVKDFEWIVVGDGLSLEEEQDYLITGITKCAVLYNNYGPSVARNVGFQISDGDIITYVDAGDELNPNRVKHIIDIFSNFTDTELLFDAYTIVQDGKDYLYNPELANSKIYGGNYIGELDFGNISIPLGVSHTRKVFVECGGFQRGIVCGEDGILWRRMYERIPGENIMFSDFNAGIYYVSQDGQSRTQRRFKMGGFAFDAGNEEGSHGQYLDYKWFRDFNSVELFDGYS